MARQPFRELSRTLRAAATILEWRTGRPFVIGSGREASYVLHVAEPRSRVSVNHEDWLEAHDRWADRSAEVERHGIVVDRAGLDALIAAGAIFAGSLGLSASARGDRGEDWVVSAVSLCNLAWTQGYPRPPQGAVRWPVRGYWRCRGGGWVSIAVGDQDELGRLRCATGGISRRRPLPEPPHRMASQLQEWGLAAAPAGSGRSGDSYRGCTRRSVPAGGWAGAGDLLPDGALVHAAGAPSPRETASLVCGEPLDGLRFIVLGQLIAAPFAGAVLAAAGARVHLVHHPVRPPLEFGVPRILAEPTDLAADPGRSRFRELLAGVNGVVDNFRPRVLANLGLREAVRKSGARHVALPAFSPRGRRSNWRALGFQLEALAGVGMQPAVQAPVFVPAGETPIVSDYVAALAGAAHLLLPGSRGRPVVLSQEMLLRRTRALIDVC